MKKPYRVVGITLLIANVILLISGFLKFLAALLVLPGFYPALLQVLNEQGKYGLSLFYLFMILETLTVLWGIILSIVLIKNKVYNKQLLWWVYSLIVIKVLAFVLYALLLKSYTFADLIVAVVVYVFLILHNNSMSRLVKNKVR